MPSSYPHDCKYCGKEEIYWDDNTMELNVCLDCSDFKRSLRYRTLSIVMKMISDIESEEKDA